MKNTTPARHTIRFRRWSRKAYAAFASIGRCVTIGSLRKSVADSSLSKQKTTGTAGHAGCNSESAWKGKTEGRETDIGIPLGSETALICEKTGMNLQVLLPIQAVCSCVNAGRQEEHSLLRQRNNTGTDYRNSSGAWTGPQHSGNPCPLFYNYGKL
ncbi:hypothetical protein AAE250_22365 [Bacteroides sp. GD17]|jgi:hypothetical protein|uniref:hypothetical protein n=1 Tax=Bacteroides sp. GD17 TaxID=3139826 RepID=UPI0025E5F525|nr:hypothetical protein [uncultured Bacteroides sp.]